MCYSRNVLCTWWGCCRISQVDDITTELNQGMAWMTFLKTGNFLPKVKKNICSLIIFKNCDFYGSYRFLTPFKENSYKYNFLCDGPFYIIWPKSCKITIFYDIQQS